MIFAPPMGVTDARLLDSNVPETDYTAYNAGTTYAAGARVRYVATDFHKVYESAQAGNLGHSLLDEAWWLEVGATNRWALFDDRHSTQTVQAESIEVSVQGSGIIDTVAILNTDATSLRVVVTDAGEGVVYDETFDLVDLSGLVDAYTYCFDPYVYVRDLPIVDLPPYPDAQIDVYIEAPDSTVRCGGLVFALKVEMGGTQWGAQLALQDTSLKTRDDWGEYFFVERPFYKTVDSSVWVPTGAISYLQNQLAPFRATPILWILDPDVGAGVGLAIYEDLVFVLSEGDLSLSTLRLGMLI